MKKILVLISVLWLLFLASCWKKIDENKEKSWNVNEKISTQIIEDDSLNILKEWDENKEMIWEKWNDWMIDKDWEYVLYSADTVISTEWNKVLFFHAPWCGSCKTADVNITASWVPSWLTIFKVDYDSNLELRKKYWIVAQHSFVQVDNEWNMIKKWVWGKTIEDITWEIWVSEKTSQTFEKGTYKEITLSQVADEIKAGKWRRVLFFHASWCTTCKSADENIKLSEIPAGLSIFKIDYDESIELKQKYGVTTQHTFIEVDKNMNLLKKWSGSKTVEDILTGLGEHKKIEKKEEVSWTETSKVEMLSKEIKKEEVSLQEIKKELEMNDAVWEYTEYSEEAINNALWDKVLFFHATWCSSCKAADKNISAEDIPAGLHIFKVDFDWNGDLRKKYEVLWQHTFVQIDNNWKMIKKWFGSRSVKDIQDSMGS